MLDESFAEAWVNRIHRVLGIQLRPFSLWHRFVLGAIESPILEQKPILLHELEYACRACSLGYPKIPKTKINTWSLRWRLGGSSLNAETQKFGIYLTDFYALPRFIPPVRKKHLPDDINHPPPEDLQIFSAIATMTGWDEKTIWDLPIGQAYWYAAGHWYQSGQELDFLTPEHLVLQERIAKMRQQKSNG